MLNLDFKLVESSNLKEVAFDADKQELFIRFKQGNALWKYSPVSENDYKAFMSAESLGSFFHKHIKTNPGIKAEKQ